MKKTLIFICIIGILTIFVFNSCNSEDKKTLYSEINKYQNEIKEKELENQNLQSENNDLKAENESLSSVLKKSDEQIDILKEKNKAFSSGSNQSSTSKTLNYLAVKFWQDGKNYKVSETSEKLYKNPYLSKEVSKETIIVSPTIDELRLENGQTVYSIMSVNGLVYTSSYPNLTEIESTKTISAKSISDEASKKYISLKFWKGEHKRKLHEGSNQIWFSDHLLSLNITNSDSIIIVSENVDYFKLFNKVTVYAALSENGNIVWMHEAPSLENIN